MSKHTPGPWSYIALDEWSHRVVTSHGTLPDGTPSYWTVADINKRREPEHEANARLIAAAPDLLEALKDVLTWGTDQNYVRAKASCDKARAAIAKAEGEKA